MATILGEPFPDKPNTKAVTEREPAANRNPRNRYGFIRSDPTKCIMQVSRTSKPTAQLAQTRATKEALLRRSGYESFLDRTHSQVAARAMPSPIANQSPASMSIIGVRNESYFETWARHSAQYPPTSVRETVTFILKSRAICCFNCSYSPLSNSRTFPQRKHAT
jgi:hypothetical protein